MKAKSSFLLKNILFGLGVVVLFLIDLSLGSVQLSLTDIFDGLFAFDKNPEAQLVLNNFRIPRVLTAVLAGAGLSVAGLLMQTLFQNPLAGPYVLGINSGASLMVALATMIGFSVVGEQVDLIVSALIGALGAGLFILFCSVYVRNKISLLLIGVMFGSFSGALVNVIQSYSNPDDLKMFMLWSFGSLQNVTSDQLFILTTLIVVAIGMTLLVVKPLDLLVLGDREASVMGVKVRWVRIYLVLITAILTGVITAYCGPIAFVGLVVPNIVKIVYRSTSHLQLLIGVILMGSLLVLLCDIVMQLMQTTIHLPLNALTALVGAPIVVWIIIRKF